MILKDPKTNALLNIDGFEAIYPLEDKDIGFPEFNTKIIMSSHAQSSGWYGTKATAEELLEYIKTKRLFVVASWKQKWN